MTHTEERTQASIPALKKIISKTVANRDSWDASYDGKLRKILQCTVAAAKYRQRAAARDCEIIAGQDNAPQQETHATDKIKLRALEDFHNREFVDKLDKALRMLSYQQLTLKTMRMFKVREQGSIEMKMFSVLKEIGVKLSSCHGGSLNGKDIKKVMNNACCVFDTFSTVFKGGKRQNCMLLDANIDTFSCSFARCLFYGTVFFVSEDNKSNRSKRKNLQFICQCSHAGQ
jgi:hypothetical protein